MKTLLLIRHAKSSWDDIMQKDFDRTLNKRGLRDAPEMAERLLKKKIQLDAFVSSPAVRALTTCFFFAKAYGKKEADVIQISALYLATVPVFYQVIAGLNDGINNVALFSHNDGITAFANTLTDTHIDNMPTCSVYAIKVETNSWSHFEKAKKQFWFFDYPKNL